MNVLKDLMGFAVLTSPLWLLLILVPLALWIGAKAAKKVDRRGAGIAVRVLVIALVLLIPFGDEIVGRAYFSRLCDSEGGVRIYKSFELPADYWDEHDRPRFFNKQGHLDRDLWLKALDESDRRVERYSSLFSIEKDFLRVKERTTREVAAEVITFRYWGGWIRRNLSPHNTANSCEFIRDPAFSRHLYSQLFRPPTSSK